MNLLTPDSFNSPHKPDDDDGMDNVCEDKSPNDDKSIKGEKPHVCIVHPQILLNTVNRGFKL